MATEKSSATIDDYVRNVFSDKGVCAELSLDEWLGGWASIVGGVNGIPTSQQFNAVFNILSSITNQTASTVNAASRTANDALPKTSFNADAIIALLKAKGLMTGCNSDMLDGKHSTDFAAAKHSHNASDINAGTLPIARGGTGASTADAACDSLGAMRKAGGTFTGTVYFGNQSYYIDSSGVANFSRAYGAVYNDYAEFFPRGEDTEPGDIVALDVTSAQERYIKATNTSYHVAGVHSDEYGMLIGGNHVENAEDYVSENLKIFIPVALAGRVHVKVVGTVRTGDYIIPSEIPGVGRAVKFCEVPKSGQVVGYAVECDDRTDIRKIRVRVGERG